MQKKILNRLLLVSIAGLFIVLGLFIILSNLKSSITFFYPLSELSNLQNIKNPIRIGGIVKIGSIKKFPKGDMVFILTDGKNEVEVYFKGIIPLLFREHQWIIVKGNWQNTIFYAKELLTKHDETYRPK